MIELMIVVVVIGILSAIAIPKFQQAIEEAKLKEAQAVLKAIRNAEKVFKAERGAYVGVDIDGAAADKTNWWTMLRIQDVTDTTDWKYGVEVKGCGCNAPPGNWGYDTNNQTCIPYARRLIGANANKVMHITMISGWIDSLDKVALCPDVNCNQQ